MNKHGWLLSLGNIDKQPFIKSIRGGLVMIIPVLMAGSFALILKSFPVAAYLNFINTFASGLLYNIFNFIYNASFGMLSIYMTIAVGYTIAKESRIKTRNLYGAPLSAMAAFAIFTGFGTDAFTISSFGAVGMFTAIVCSTTASYMYLFIGSRLHSPAIFSDGADPGFNRAVSSIFPLAITSCIYALIEFCLCKIFAVDSFWSLIVEMFDALFANAGSNFGGSLLYVFMSSFLWFFGIHGSDVLESINQNIFIPATDANAAAVAAGGAPTEIFTKTFFDVFVLMGGCGTLLSLLIALLLFSRRKSNRSLAKIAAFPMIFNINEIMVFGLPIIYNPLMFIPFILAPLASFLIASTALTLGIVPLTSTAVEWTTPVILGGIQTTGSIAGALLQLVNIFVGVLIYMPFVKLYDARKDEQGQENISALTDTLKEHEAANMDVRLTEIEGNVGDVAKQLVNDLQTALGKNELFLQYQPQFDNDSKMIGAEALLRWKHPMFGMIYPPLVIKLAAESGLLLDLERYVFTRAKEEALNSGLNIRISINATARSLRDESFSRFLMDTFADAVDGPVTFCLEITEQSELITDGNMLNILKQLKAHGFLLAIDDFSMGFTSLKYLQESDFDIVKLDGSLVKQLMTDNNTGEIISSIVFLSKSIGFSVLAEFVETTEQKEKLQELGCREYQGYLFSKAVSFQELRGNKECSTPQV